MVTFADIEKCYQSKECVRSATAGAALSDTKESKNTTKGECMQPLKHLTSLLVVHSCHFFVQLNCTVSACPEDMHCNRLDQLSVCTGLPCTCLCIVVMGLCTCV